MADQRPRSAPRGWLLALLALAHVGCSQPQATSVPLGLPDAHPDAVAIRETMSRFLAAHRLSKIDTEDYGRLVTGEAVTRVTKPIKSLAAVPDAVRIATDGRAVVRVALREGDEDSELYFYLQHTTEGWKVHALRGFAQTWIFREIIREARSLPPSEETDYSVANAKLVLMRDTDLRAWFFAHKSELDALARAAKDHLKAGAWATTSKEWKYHETMSPEIRRLALNAVFHHEDGSIKVSVGGVTDNEVGFMLVVGGTAPLVGNQEDGDDFIWVEPLTDGWHLFRTTCGDRLNLRGIADGEARSIVFDLPHAPC